MGIFLLLWKVNTDHAMVLLNGWVAVWQQNALPDPRQNYHIKGKTVSAAEGEGENDERKERKRAPDDGRQALSTDPSIDPQ